MTWINVDNDKLESFYYPEYGMDKPVDVTDTRKAQVSEDAAEQLIDHPSGDFSMNEETDYEYDSE